MYDESFIARLAQPRPDPGGGGAAAYAACVALALLEKILRLEAGRPRGDSEKSRSWEGMLARCRLLFEEFRLFRDEDSRSYMKLSEAKGARGSAVWDAALDYATECPVRIAEEACRALDLAVEAGKKCSIRLLSDVLASCEMLAGAGRAACRIAVANVGLMSNRGSMEKFTRRIDEILAGLAGRLQAAGDIPESRK